MYCKTASWIVVDRATGRAVGEFYDPAIVAKINLDKYEALPALTYLQQLNAKIKPAQA